MAINTLTNVTNNLQGIVNRAALEVGMPYLCHAKWGKKYTIPQGNKGTLNLERFEKLSTTESTPIVEGVPPSSMAFSTTKVSISLTQLGSWTEWTDMLQWYHELDIDMNVVKRVTEQMMETGDKFTRDQVLSGVTGFYQATDDAGAYGTGALTTVAGSANPVLFNKVIRDLANNLAKYIEGPIAASTKVSTYGIRDSFIAIVDPAIRYDLETTSIWAAGTYRAKNEYGDTSQALEGEIGSYKHVRFIETTFVKNTAGGGAATAGKAQTGGNNDVHSILVFGQDAYGTVNFGAGNATKVTKKNAEVSVADQLGQKHLVSWKSLNGAGVLNTAWIRKVNVAVQA
jgi:N4-gp56 family major capsid protein